LRTDRYDVVVIGGGIHGAGVAQAAAAAGYSVLVLEQQAVAAGTSSRSTKLIHGGLRYLESGQLSLVRECLRERALLLRNAPELVRLRPFYIPIYRDTRRRPWQLRAGLSLYALLGGLGPDTRFERVPRRAWEGLDGLDTTGLQTVFCYWDAQTDDAALTRAVMESALGLGAQLDVPARFLRGELEERGCVVHFEQRGVTRSCEASVLVNAAGPWVNAVLSAFTPAPKRLAMDLVAGTHIVVAGGLARGVYYLEAAGDGRAVFAAPWRDNILVGTTETDYRGDPAEVRPLPEERRYLLETLARYFPAYRSAGDDMIQDAFAGLRVLPSGEGAPFRRTRETVLYADRQRRPRLLTIYGGKLTAYRATAARVIERLRPSLPRRAAMADPRTLRLSPAGDGGGI